MPISPIRFYDRYRKEVCEEAVYGEWALKLLYGNRPGRWIGPPLLSRPLFSKLFGWYMRRPGSRARILPFIERYNLDPSEFIDPVDAFDSFNAFFCRKLKPGSRPVDDAQDSIVFPADGRHLGWQEIGDEHQVFAKGQSWDLPGLLKGDPELIEKFERCTLVLSRLCPVDYHHFHFPADGILASTRWHDKSLFSVNPIALRHKLSYLWQNKRCISVIKSEVLGDYCMIEIGATNVGSIHHQPLPYGSAFKKGDARGWFEFGGSSVITLFQKGRVRLAGDLLSRTAEGIELYAKMGDRMGVRS